MATRSLLNGCLLPFLLSYALAEAPPSTAHREATVEVGKARFTVLTPHIVRMEWASDAVFEDRASLFALHRRLPVPEFESSQDGDTLRIRTEALELSYDFSAGAFDSTNLRIDLRSAGPTASWRPGAKPTGNLGGTVRALDGATGPVDLGLGFLSRDGWSVIDDSRRPLLEGVEETWVAPRAEGRRQDLYFLGHGRDYVQVLGELAQITGRVPLPPRYAFGLWWSRYWAFTDVEMMQLVEEFERRSIPLDVLVIDMDWHETLSPLWGSARPRDQAGEYEGWTGYTWNKSYFPDPDAFLDWAEQRGLRTPLNLHPASGIQPHEASYEAMARATGIDPASGRYVPLALEDREFVRSFFELVIRPLESQGVDFWWLDWLPKRAMKTPGLDPTLWINHIFHDDMERRGAERPLIMHRYGGIGNHRYPIGFSGDTYSTWELLSFLPHCTATAANVLFGYWSHDIGGHLGPRPDPELYTRWIQFGAFSPILRTHATKKSHAARAIWEYPQHFEAAMREAILLRSRLVPYVYTAARAAHDDGISIVRPMYYSHTEFEEAYAAESQYMFGADLLVNPVTRAADAVTGLAPQRTWLPPGDWYEWPTGRMHSGDRWLETLHALAEIPIFVRAGAIVPMETEARRAGAPGQTLALTVFPGPGGSGRVYEDDGKTQRYRRGEFSWTGVRHESDRGIRRVQIDATEGEFPGAHLRRAYEIHLVGEPPPERILVDGIELEQRPDRRGAGWWFDGEAITTVLRLSEARRDRPRSVEIFQRAELDADALDGLRGLRTRLRMARSILDEHTPRVGAPESLIDLIQTTRRIELDPATVTVESARLAERMAAAVQEIRGFPGGRAAVNRALALLGEDPLPPQPAVESGFGRKRLAASAVLLAGTLALLAWLRKRPRHS